jgi:transposase
MEDLSDFERGKIVGTCLTGKSATKTATLLGVSRATVSKVMSACTNHRKTISAKKNSGRKSTLTERDRRTLRRVASKNHRTNAAQLNIHSEDPVPTKTVRYELHKYKIHDRAAIAQPRITEINTQMRKWWCHDHKTWTSDKWKFEGDMVR